MAGKGDADRTTDRKRAGDNHDCINWDSKRKDEREKEGAE
jgi:hypothetical protein